MAPAEPLRAGPDGRIWRRFIDLHLQRNGFAVLQRYYERHFTPTGKALLLLFLISLSLGMVGTEVMIYVFLSCQLGLWAGVGLLGSLNRPRRLQAEMIWPGQLQAGQPALCRLRITHSGTTRYHLSAEILLQGPDGQSCRLLPEQECFSLSTDAAWECRLSWTPPGRGQWRIKEMLLLSTFPLNLIRWLQVLRPAHSVWVYPACFELETSWQQPQLQQLSSQASQLRGQSLEFQGIRPWLPGDSPRLIHWPTLARSGQLAVREFQDSPGHQLGLLLQTPGQGASEQAFETAVSLMAGLIRQIAAQPYHQLTLALLGRRLSSNRQAPLQGEELLLQLAGIQRDEAFDLEACWPLLLAPTGPTLLICLCTHWTPALTHFEQTCRQRRLPIELLAIGEADQPFPASVQRFDPATWSRR